jgi:general secretion pathway protein K
MTRQGPKAAKQQGVALIIVLMVVALVSILATEMGSRLQLQVKRAANIKDNNQAYWYAMGAEEFARKSILELIKANGEVINLNQPWAQEFIYPLTGGGIQAKLEDQQSCFNINTLGKAKADGEANSEELVAFRSLLDKVELDIPDFSADTLRDSLADWLDADSNLREYGAEDNDYESLAHPYVAANTLMSNKSELRLVNGVEQTWLKDLLPLLCVLPETELSININTLGDDKVALLAALTGLNKQDAGSLIRNRNTDGYKNASDFLAQPEFSQVTLSDKQKAWFTVTTKYFILHTKTRYNNATFAMDSVFHIGQNNQVKVIMREFGGQL